jgi:LiaI-LiaF-like transmembrane region
MKTSNIFWGTLFIALGLLFLLINFSALNLDWENIWQLWPIIIVLLGISMLVNSISGSGGDYSSHEYREAFDSSITNVVLYLEGGAGNIKIGSITDNLIFVKTECTKSNFNFIKTDTNNIAKLKLRLRGTSFLFNNIKCNSKVDIALNEEPIWKLDFNLGAASTRLDLTKYKVEDIKMDMGAANLDVKLGALSEHLNFNLNSGASKIDISVPEEVGTQIKMDAVLSSKNIVGFKNLKSGLYRTEGFNDAEKKIFIEIDSGVSSINISRYLE